MTLKMFMPETINWICGPSYKLGEKEFRVVHYDFKKLGLLSKCKIRNSPKTGDMRIYFEPMDSLCEVVSADKPESLVGEGLDHVIMSEAAKHRMSTWEMYIQPALADKRGSADFPSTPQGFNWFKGLYDLGLDPNNAMYESWHFPTWTNLAAFPDGYDDEELVQIRETVSRMFWDQEYAALFTAYEGLIYSDFDPQIHVKPFEYNPMWENYWALDFGFKDPFVCLDIMVNPLDQRAYVWREYQVPQKITSEHGVALKTRENPDGFHIDGIYADPRGAEEIATLQMLFGSISANGLGVVLGVEAVSQALRVRPDGLPGLIIHPSCRRLINQMQSVHAKPGTEKTGNFVMQGDDHGPDALRYFFNERFIIGGADGLADLYNVRTATEADTFFKYGNELIAQESYFRA
jgi:hypothetical protein